MNKEKMIKEYSELYKAKYRAFAKLVADIVSSILDANKVATQSVTCREKSPKSLAEKIARDGKSYIF